MTWNELVGEVVPELPEGARGMVLWEYTAYPFDTAEGTILQLKEFRERWLANDREWWDPLAEAFVKAEEEHH